LSGIPKSTDLPFFLSTVTKISLITSVIHRWEHFNQLSLVAWGYNYSTSSVIICEILGFHGGDDDDDVLLGFGAV
jgi:hypothetical protein